MRTTDTLFNLAGKVPFGQARKVSQVNGVDVDATITNLGFDTWVAQRRNTDGRIADLLILDARSTVLVSEVVPV